jgi:hypothetical protein
MLYTLLWLVNILLACGSTFTTEAINEFHRELWSFAEADKQYCYVDTHRTLWSAGWNARNPTYFANTSAPPIVRWSPEAEAMFVQHYR